MSAPFQSQNGPRQFRPSGFYVFQPRPPPTAAYPSGIDMDGKRVRKTLARRTVDYNWPKFGDITGTQKHSHGYSME